MEWINSGVEMVIGRGGESGTRVGEKKVETIKSVQLEIYM